jgi:hypothetical protein
MAAVTEDQIYHLRGIQVWEESKERCCDGFSMGVSRDHSQIHRDRVLAILTGNPTNRAIISEKTRFLMLFPGTRCKSKPRVCLPFLEDRQRVQ